MQFPRGLINSMWDSQELIKNKAEIPRSSKNYVWLFAL